MDAPGNSSASAALQDVLQILERQGLRRPPSLTLEQYLGRLVTAGLLSAAAVERYLEAYGEVRYGDREVSPERLERVCGALERELVALDRDGAEELLEDARQRLSPPTPAPAAAAAPSRGRPTGPMIPLSPPPAGSGAAATSTTAASGPGPAAPPRGLRDRLPSGRALALVLAAVLVWSVAMLGVGYWQSHRIGSLVKKLRPHKRPHRFKSRRMLSRLRKAASARPDDLRRWRRYASFAFQIERYPDAIIGYHHIITRTPRDHESLNNLAWLYCTARDPSARDKKRALALAERAYALDRAPHIVDTLAEACFQNGFFQRAVKLEQDALKRAKQRKEFFRKQLEKFRRAAGSPIKSR